MVIGEKSYFLSILISKIMALIAHKYERRKGFRFIRPPLTGLSLVSFTFIIQIFNKKISISSYKVDRQLKVYLFT